MLGDLHMHQVSAIDVIYTRDYVDWTMLTRLCNTSANELDELPS
jgi:hypothetical protein